MRRDSPSPRRAAWPTNTSCSVITSDSIRSTSVMWVMRREPSTRRADLDEQVERARDLLADRTERQVDAGREDERLQAGERVAGGVGVDRRQRALVAGVHGLEHVERLRAADLADDDPVGPHAQGVPDELADPDLALALDVRRARLERDHVILLELELGRVLDRDDALVVGHERRQGVERRRLSGAGAAGDEDVQLALHAGGEELRGLGRERAELDQVVHRVRVARELPDRQRRALERERRDDRVDAAAVGQARVDHRRGLVDAPADLRDDLVDDAQQVRVVDEGRARVRSILP